MDMVHYTNKPIGKGMQYPNRYTKNSVTSYLHDAENVRVNKICIYTSVATKIENRPKTNTKNLCQFKNSSNIFEDCKFFEYLQRYEDF